MMLQASSYGKCFECFDRTDDLHNTRMKIGNKLYSKSIQNNISVYSWPLELHNIMLKSFSITHHT
jgi:hypothetical protein